MQTPAEPFRKDPRLARSFRRLPIPANLCARAQYDCRIVKIEPFQRQVSRLQFFPSQMISIVSSESCLALSSLPVSSKELVRTALPFSTLVIT